jgi:hypothetical protein
VTRADDPDYPDDGGGPSGRFPVLPTASSPTPATLPPAARRQFAVTVIVVGLASLLLWPTPVMLPLRLLVTLVHEAGHATVAMLCGASVQSVTINAREGGLTHFSLAHRSTWRMIAIGSAGYVGTAVVGGALLELASRTRRARLALGVLAAIVVAIGLAWVPWSTDPDARAAAATGSSTGDGRFTILCCVLYVGVLVGLAVQPHLVVRRVALVAIATALCLGAVQDLRVVLSLSRTDALSDATIVASVAPLPAWCWAGLWFVLGVAACGLGLWSALTSPGRSPGTARPR